MTVEKKTFIQLTDILSIDCKCPSCEARFSIPIRKFEHPLSKCQNCKEELIGTGGIAPDDLALKEFIASLRELTGRKFGQRIRLEVAGIPETKA